MWRVYADGDGDDDRYECELDDRSVEKACRELNEDPKDRLNAVRALRTWLLQQPHITFYTDAPTLLSYLRASKFSQLKARQQIEKFAQVMTESSRWVRNIDAFDERLLRVIDTGTAVILPKRDKNGCVIMIWRIGAAVDKDGKLLPVDDEVRAFLLVSYLLLRDENVQVNGCIFIIDMTGFSAKQLSRWTNTELRKLDSAFQKCMPGRYKAFHYYNAGPLFDALMGLIKPFMVKKFQERIVVHDTMESLYKSIDMELLPTDYLPDDYKGPNVGSLADITANMKRELTKREFRDLILERTSDKYGIDEKKRPTYKQEQASYRKLATDD
jgi:hypothetical protein